MGGACVRRLLTLKLVLRAGQPSKKKRVIKERVLSSNKHQLFEVHKQLSEMGARPGGLF